MNKLLLIGAGGHCKSIINTLKKIDCYDEIFIVDIQKQGNFIMGCQVIGSDEDLPKLFQQGYTEAFVSVGSVGNVEIRLKLTKMLDDIGFKQPNIVDPDAKVAVSVTMGRGNFIGTGAIINAEVNLSDFVIVNTGAIIEHECKIGSFSHIAPGAVLCGNVGIGDCVHIGAGSVVKQGITIGTHSIVGINSTVVKDILSGSVVVGTPADIISLRKGKK